MRDNSFYLHAKGTNRCGDITHVNVWVHYSKGGINYATYKQEARGIYVTFTPVKLERTGSGFISESFTAFTGAKFVFEEATRLNSKRVLAVYGEVERQIKAKQGIAWDILQKVVEREGLTLVEPSPTPATA
jgi:hypothetical protein